MTTSKTSIQSMCYVALCAAIIAIMAQLSIPMPLGVPMTMQTFAITLSAVILGAKRGACASLIYILAGAVGFPVLAGFCGGLQYFAGPTGGFLISFPLMAYITGLGVDRFRHVKGGLAACVTAGVLINYAFGVFFFCLLTKSTVLAGFTA